ncbi:MAG: hypothetical protein ACI3ZL_02390 [Candidatus Cryptobacteroides sp.]
MDNFIDIRKLNLDELMGVVNLYPWFGGARKELCRRMVAMGGQDFGQSQFADAAMYVGDRGKLYQMMRSSHRDDWADADVEELLKTYIAEPSSSQADVAESRSEGAGQERRVHVVGGDFFSQEDYDRVRKSDDNVFSRYAAKARQEKSGAEPAEPDFDIYTETLASIYAEQGYYDHAKRIYSKLILAYPEKNAYFAALIEKLEKINSL